MDIDYINHNTRDMHSDREPNFVEEKEQNAHSETMMVIDDYPQQRTSTILTKRPRVGVKSVAPPMLNDLMDDDCDMRSQSNDRT